MKEKNRRRVLLGVVVGHLIVVALGAAGVRPRPPGLPGLAIERYMALSGAGHSFGFFAPEVTGQPWASFEVTDGEGKKTITTLETGSSHEADLRVGDIIDTLGGLADDAESLRRDLAASLAKKIFGRHPEAREVAVQLYLFETVSMEEFRRGSRPLSRPIYSARFAKKLQHME